MLLPAAAMVVVTSIVIMVLLNLMLAPPIGTAYPFWRTFVLVHTLLVQFVVQVGQLKINAQIHIKYKNKCTIIAASNVVYI